MKTVSVPSSASERLPRTGASSRPVRSPSTDASRRTASAPTVDISITVAPAPTPAATPSPPSVTSRNAAGSATIVSTTSARAAASAGVAAAPAPASTSGAAFSAARFQTTRSWPASRRRRAMRLPIAPSPTPATPVTRPRLLRLARTVRPAGVPAALPGADDVVRRQRVRERRARLRRPRSDRLEGGPRLRPRRAVGAAGDLPPRRRDLGRQAAAPPRDGGLERRERPLPGRGRRAPPFGTCPHLAARRARRPERHQLGVLLPRLDRDRAADRAALDAPERERTAAAGPQLELHRRRRPPRPRRRRDEPRHPD